MDTIAAAIVFENHAGHTVYHVIHNLRNPVTVSFPLSAR